MHRGKKPKKKKPSASLQLTPEEEALVHAQLTHFKAFTPIAIAEKIQKPVVAEALVESLPSDDPAVVAVLKSLYQKFEQKDVRKAIKKATFKLRQKGISVADFEEDGRGILSPKGFAEEGDAKAYLGSIDTNGSRAVFLAVPRIPKGFDVGIGVISDELGMIQFHYGIYSKKRMKDLKTRFREEIGISAMVEVSLSHVATVLEKAYGVNRDASGKTPPDYLSLRPWILENVELLERPVIYEHLNEPEGPEDLITDSQIDKLFGHELMAGWFIEPEGLKSLAEQILQVENSPILLSETQKGARIDSLKDDFLKEHYPASRREILRNRLEEMAYVFFKRDEAEYARLSLAGSLTLKEPDRFLQTNPILSFLLERSLGYFLEALQEDKRRPGGVVDDSSSPLILT